VRTAWIRSAGLAVALGLVGLFACGERGETAGPQPGSSASGASGTVTVFAAASLTEAFQAIGKGFEAANPGAKVAFNFAGSSALATQINEGAPADVFASASPANLKTVTDAGHADGSPTLFARNQLVIAVPRGNPKGVTDLADLTRVGMKVAVCAEQVPCGAAAKKALDAAGVGLTPVTLEQDVKAALAKLRLGEVDAALVYRTDTRASAADLDGVEFPESAGAINDYPIVLVKNAPNEAAARAFLAYVVSDEGRTALTAAGFQAP
jgi:molybdate transport system substrate-binding protein